MKPAPFAYFRPESIAEVLTLLERHQDDAKILAGGQSLVPILNFRLNHVKHLIDINRVGELSFISVNESVLRIGAMTRYRTIENSSVVAAAAPLLAQATKSIAHLPIRTRGTIGGSVAHADPAAEYPAVLLALDATVVARNHAASREIAAADFFRGLFTTELSEDELLTEIRIPVARKTQAFGFEEFARRPGDLAIVGIAGRLDYAGAQVSAARVVVFGVEGGPQRIAEAEEELIGNRCDIEHIERAARAAAAISAQSDVHATGGLRKHLAGVLTRRVLCRAARSATTAEP